MLGFSEKYSNPSEQTEMWAGSNEAFSLTHQHPRYRSPCSAEKFAGTQQMNRQQPVSCLYQDSKIDWLRFVSPGEDLCRINRRSSWLVKVNNQSAWEPAVSCTLRRSWFWHKAHCDFPPPLPHLQSTAHTCQWRCSGECRAPWPEPHDRLLISWPRKKNLKYAWQIFCGLKWGFTKNMRNNKIWKQI